MMPSESKKVSDIFPGSSRLIEGVVPCASLLLMGPTGIGKTIFCKQFIFSGLIEGEQGIYVSTDESPEDVVKSMKEMGFDVDPFIANNSFKVVDCYTWKLGTSSSSKYFVKNPTDLLAVMKAIDDAKDGQRNVRMVLDSITGLTSICGHNLLEVVRFLQVLVAKIHSTGCNAIFIAAPEAHDPQFISHFRLIFDGTLEMKEDESGKQIKRLFRVFSLKGAQHKTSWTPFEITNSGIVLKNENQLRCAMCARIIDWEPIEEFIEDKKHVFDKPECASTYKKLKDLYGESFE
jgi:KaiC/GvpD/RAD55 family RecA-like ATPase